MIREIEAYEIFCDCCDNCIVEADGNTIAFDYESAARLVESYSWTYVLKEGEELFATKSYDELLEIGKKLRPDRYQPWNKYFMYDFFLSILCPECTRADEELKKFEL